MSTTPHIVLFGAGKSATVLIDFLVKTTAAEGWQLTVADHDEALVKRKLGDATHAQAAGLDIHDEAARTALVAVADVVISLMPPALHFLLAQDCLRLRKHLLTASYVDEQIRALKPAIDEAGLLFLCEMGLDPGIDHMSAMQLIHRIQQQGGRIQSFRSHCGGLVAPESDDNPWHYKISWNPRNVVLAGKQGAIFKDRGTIKEIRYQELFAASNEVSIPGLGALAFYPNRDSLGYIPIYQLDMADTFVRTTLRYPAFCQGWNQVIALRLTDEQISYDTSGMTGEQFLHQHLAQHQLSLPVMDEAFQKQLEALGLLGHAVLPDGKHTAADILQFLLETRLPLEAADKDMVVMLHEIEYVLHGATHTVNSSLVVKGQDALRTAMAKTVGLPLGIAATLLLRNQLPARGLRIPILPEIYNPVLHLLEEQGIMFEETTV